MHSPVTPFVDKVRFSVLKIGLSFLTFIPVLNLSAQQSNLSCNTLTPWIPTTFTVSETHDSPGLACWEGDFLCPGDDVPANVVNSNTTDFATGEISGIGSLELRVTDATSDYDAGNFAGFRISSVLLDIGLFSSITVSTYLNGTLQESVSSGSLLVIGLDLTNDRFDLGFITSMTFDAIEIEIDSSLGIGFYNVYYALMQDFCPGPDLECNVQTPMNLPEFPVTIDYLNTGSGGITVGEVLDPENAISASTSDYASLVNFVSVAGSTFITVEEQITNYPSGTFVGFDIQNFVVLGSGILNNLTITTYLNDVQQESKSGPDLLISGSLLSASGRQTVGFATTTSVDKVKLSVNQPLGLNLGTTRVYSAIFQEFCAGPPLECNELISIHNPEYPVFIDGAHTGFTGVACALCNVLNAGNVIDDDLSNWADIIVVAGVTSVGSLAVKDQLTDYPAGTFAGFHIENASLVDANVLSGITVSTYLNGTLQESETNLGALITVGSGLLTGTGEQYVGFITTEPFDEVKISLANIVGTFDIGTTRIYSAVFEKFCETVIECDTTYYLTNPEFPVYIDAFLTGVDGVACVGCEVDDEQNLLTEDTSDYATITVVADVIGSASIAVADALYTYPAGTFAGFVIEDLGFLLEAELFESLTISTYNNGVFQESRTGIDLIDLAVFILFISADEGRYNVGFEATLPFDEIRITVGSLVTAINVVRVYAAFVDTRASDGGSLSCVDGPIAVDDYAVTDEETPVTIDVLSNDIDNESPLGMPNLEDGPSYGSATLNPDSTFTYTPDDNFVGIDTFSYSICNDDSPALCDDALVIVTVNPVIDTIEETIPENTTLTICAENLTTFNSPATSLNVCGQPANGTATSMGDCVTYTPDPGFNGMDTFCVVTCHPDIPAMCDTTIVIVTVTPVDAPPNAVDDMAVTDEDVPVTIDVLENDSDPDSELGFPTVVEPPAHGFVVVNLDSTITYNPNENFVGVDTFFYSICDDTEPPLCDTAAVVITVLPQRDTLTEIISIDSLLELCVSAWVEFEEPDTVSICGIPEHGTVTVIDTCFEYLPDPGYSGEDTVCVIVCDVNEICDTTIFIVIIELPLPVKWISFDVYREESVARLQWTTTNEFNNAGFEIERSSDGMHFIKIGAMPPKEIQSVESLNSYQFIDNGPSRGINYYRIRQNDRDGYYHYSPVKSVIMNDGDKYFTIWPNPSSGLLHVELFNPSHETIEIKLIDSRGRICYKWKCEECGDVNALDFNSIAGGIYMLVIDAPSGRYIKKITIMK